MLLGLDKIDLLFYEHCIMEKQHMHVFGVETHSSKKTLECVSNDVLEHSTVASLESYHVDSRVLLYINEYILDMCGYISILTSLKCFQLLKVDKFKLRLRPNIRCDIYDEIMT